VTVSPTRVAVELTAAEGAVARACLLPGIRAVVATQRLLASRDVTGGVCTSAPVQANRITTLRLDRTRGPNTLAVRVAAEANADRASTVVRRLR
jgi:hypothetical protein